MKPKERSTIENLAKDFAAKHVKWRKLSTAPLPTDPDAEQKHVVDTVMAELDKNIAQQVLTKAMTEQCQS